MCHLISSSSEVGIVLTSTLEDGQIKNMKRTSMCECFCVAEKERPGVSQPQSSHSYPAIIFAFYLCIVYIYYFLSSSLEFLDPCRVQIYKSYWEIHLLWAGGSMKEIFVQHLKQSSSFSPYLSY